MSRKGKCTVSGEMTAYGAHSGLILAESRNYPRCFQIGGLRCGLSMPDNSTQTKRKPPLLEQERLGSVNQCWNTGRRYRKASTGSQATLEEILKDVSPCAQAQGLFICLKTLVVPLSKRCICRQRV